MRQIVPDQTGGFFSFQQGRTWAHTGMDSVWAVAYPRNLFEKSSIPQEVLEYCLELCDPRWTGWSFELDSQCPLLLFEDPEDAIVAEILYGGPAG